VSLLVLAFLFITVVLRAGRLSLTSDEALTYLFYLDGPINKIFFSPYEANNHVLNSVLCWVSIHLFGLNEFNLRIPSLAASVVFFATVYRLSSWLFEKRVLHVLAVVLLAGNPYLLDFFSLARGYSLALAFFSLALFNVMLSVRDAELQPERLFRIALWLAASVTANLAYLFPAVALWVTLALLASRYTGTRWQSVLPLASRFLRFGFGPFLVFSFCVLIMPLHYATKDTFYFGAGSWHDTVESLVSPTLFHNARIPLLAKWPALFWAIYQRSQTVFVPVLALLACALAVAALLRWRQANAALFVAAVTFAVLLLGLSFAFYALGVKLPMMRTALYLLVLLPLPFLALLGIRSERWERRAGLSLSPLLVLWALFYVAQWNTARSVIEWRFDASTREFAKAIEILRVACRQDSIRVGGSWIFGSSLNFYRFKYAYTHWLPVGRPNQPSDPADYYVLSATDRPVVDALHLRVIIDDPLSGSILATAGSPCSR
jgi:hypothetical protein